MRVPVDLADRSYEVVLERGARHALAQLLKERAPRAQVVAVVTSHPLRSQPWFEIDSGLVQHVLEVPDGERAKTWEVVAKLCEELAALELSREDVVVGVGGGAITDLAGFASAVYLRGIGVVQIPTTLVGQVDAAIGGKTGVNLPAGKNLVGAFHQPLGVLCDFAMLDTLPERERLGGLGEVAKCWLLEGRRAEDLGAASLADLIVMSVKLKAAIVAGDEFEGGRRAWLNYGHTLGHAVELLALQRSTDELRHGEAVAIGLAFAVRLAHALGRIEALEVDNHDRVLSALGLTAVVPDYMADSDLLRAMMHDKKAHHNLTFVLPGPDGFAVVRDLEPALVRHVLETFRGGL